MPDREFDVAGMQSIGRDIVAKAAAIYDIATNLSSYSALDEGGLTPTDEYQRWNEAWCDEFRQIAGHLVDVGNDMVDHAEALSALDEAIGAGFR